MLNLNEIRKDFPILNRQVHGKPLVYFDNGATSQKPRQVISALVDYYENYNSNIHRSVHLLGEEATEKYELARNKIASFIGAKEPESIIFVKGATEGINLVANSWGQLNIHDGDEILLTPMEHHSNLVPWQILAEKTGATLKFFPLTNDGKLDIHEIDSLLTTKTKLVSLTIMSNVLGTINPVKVIINAAHSVGAKVLLDGAQSVPHMLTNVMDLDCDFLAFSGHKMLGPTGIGVLYGKTEILEQMNPFMFGGDMIREVSLEKSTWNDLPYKFEAGTPNIAGVIGLGAAVDYLVAIGIANIHEHESSLTSYALTRLEEFSERIKVFGPRESSLRGGNISFHCHDVHPHDLGTFLDREGIAIRVGHHCAMPLMHCLEVPATARASFYLYNTHEEIDFFISILYKALRYFGR